MSVKDGLLGVDEAQGVVEIGVQAEIALDCDIIADVERDHIERKQRRSA